MTQKDENGHVLTWVLGFLAAITVILVATTSVLDLVLSDSIRTNKNQLSLNIADAGVNYYLWHLSHSGADFQDGNTGGTPIVGGEFNGFYGPYEHDYKDDNGIIAGKYTLYIKPKSLGSTVAVVRAVGETNGNSNRRTVEAEIGAPSFASYGLVGDGALWFGDTESSNGPTHSNVGIRMDGPNAGDVTSANATYVPPANLGGNGTTSRNGVWCNAGTNCASRNSTNNNGSWRYPVPAVNFNAITAELCNLKKTAFLSSVATAAIAATPTACSNVTTTRTDAYIPRYQPAFNITRGYLIELNDNNTYNLYGVANEVYSFTNNNTYTSTWQAALTETLIQSNIAVPTSGVIFVEDNVWVRTNSVYEGRVTIASGRLASATEQTDVIIADDIKYEEKTGRDAIGLIAESDILIAPYAPPKPNDAASNYPFEINAALIAKDGSVVVPFTYLSRQVPVWNDPAKKLVSYGSIATRQIWTWVWTNSGGTPLRGMYYNETNYDYNLLYAPPPNFPITSTYDILKWREILVTP
jgi:hypothetical protein